MKNKKINEQPNIIYGGMLKHAHQQVKTKLTNFRRNLVLCKSTPNANTNLDVVNMLYW